MFLHSIANGGLLYFQRSSFSQMKTSSRLGRRQRMTCWLSTRSITWTSWRWLSAVWCLPSVRPLGFLFSSPFVLSVDSGLAADVTASVWSCVFNPGFMLYLHILSGQYISHLLYFFNFINNMFLFINYIDITVFNPLWQKLLFGISCWLFVMLRLCFFIKFLHFMSVCLMEITAVKW